MRTELIPAADVRIGDCVLDEQGAPAVVTSTRWQGVGGGVVSIALSNHSDRRVFSGCDPWLVPSCSVESEPSPQRRCCDSNAGGPTAGHLGVIAGPHLPVELHPAARLPAVSGDGQGVYPSSSTPAGGRIAC